MPVDPKRVQTIFLAAADQADSAQRAVLLERECGHDAELRERVEALLQAHDEPHTYLDLVAQELAATSAGDAPVIGLQIGPYKVLQQIGEGGMGAVYMAEQAEPVRRRVALKIVKPGMDSRQVIARFEAERQALALMDHQNIARVLDAGTTEQGRPYFVMELVKGQPITQYCDEKQLTPRERLELLLPVCQAIQHAHQKGIIHRDIKPTNILVAEYDERPVPKVIDFGVAKAIGSPLTDKTMFTGLGQIVGTLEYMSPEQAKVNQLDIDTRSDIYSLGVLLYELLTGSTPFNKERLKSAAFDEMLRMIREEEPEKPSTRLSGSKDSLPSISAQRQTEPARLTKLVRGELDWIVMKALEKDRNRRYETASALALDLQRYLADEPVQACPPSLGYRLRKFTRRYKKTVVTASAFLLLLVLGVVASTWQAVRATRAQGQARTAEGQARAAEEQAKVVAAIHLAVTTFVQEDLLGPADIDAQTEPGLAPDRDVKVRTLLDRAAANVKDRFAKQPLVEAAIRLTIGNAYHALGEYAKAKAELEKALEIRRRELGAEHPDTLAARTSLSHLYLHTDDPEIHKKVEQQLRETLQTCERVLRSDHPITLMAAHQWALWHESRGKFAEAERLTVQTLEARRRVLGPNHLDTLKTQHNLALVYMCQRQYAKAEALTTQTLNDCRRTLAAEHPLAISCMNNLGAAYRGQRQYAKAESQLLEGLAISRRVLGTGATTRYLLKNLAEVYLAQREYAKAEPLIVESVMIVLPFTSREEFRGPSPWLQLSDLYGAQHTLLLVEQKKYAEAEPILRELLDIYIVAKPWLRFQTHTLLGACWGGQQKYEPAEKALISGYEGLQKSEATIPLADRKLVAEALERIVQLYEAQDKSEQAAEWQKKLDLEKEQQARRTEALVEFQRGLTLAGERKFEEAKAAFGEAIRLEPVYPEAFFQLGRALAQQRKTSEAEAKFAEAVRLHPEYAEAHRFLGWARQVQGKAAEAEVAYRAAIKASGRTDRLEAEAGLGWALSRQEKWEEAIASYEKVIRLKPDMVTAHEALGRLMAMCPNVKYRNPTRAVEAAKKAVELAGQSPANWQVLGWAQYRAGNWKDTIEALEKSMALQPGPSGGGPLHWYFLAMAHCRLGEKEKAQAWYERAVDWSNKHPAKSEELDRIRAEAEVLLKEEQPN